MKKLLLLLVVAGFCAFMPAHEIKTYRNEETGFSFKFPNYWTIADKTDPDYNEEEGIVPPTVIIEKISEDVNNRGKLQKYITKYFNDEKKNPLKIGYKPARIVWSQINNAEFATTSDTYSRLTEKMKEMRYYTIKSCGSGCNGLVFTLSAPEKMMGEMQKEIAAWEKTLKVE